MSQYVPTASALAQHNGGIGALGDLTFVAEVIIVERSQSREFLTLQGESLGVVTRSPASLDTYERDKEQLSKDIQSHRFTDGTLVFLGGKMADELAEAVLVKENTRRLSADERKTNA